MKKVLIFSLAYYPRVSGAETAIKEITDRIPEIEFHLITKRFDQNIPSVEKMGNVLVHRIGRASNTKFSKFVAFPFSAALLAFSLHKKYAYDAIWAMMAHSAGVPAAIFKMCFPRVPYILTLQEGDPPEHVERVMRPFWPFFSRAFTSADMMQAISDPLGKWARRRGYKGPLEIIPNGASPESSLEYPQNELDELAKKVGKKEGEVLLLSIGRLVHQKAIDDVIRALTLLPSNVRLAVVGSGPDKDALLALAREKGVEGRVYFAGQVHRNETARFRKISDIFVLPSRSEGQGISFLSTMLSGLPIVATQEGGIADFLFDAKRNPEKPATGYAVDKNSPQQIADAVQEILANPKAAKEATRNARELVMQKYDWDIVAKDMKNKVFLKITKGIAN